MKRILQIVGTMDRAGAETMVMNLYRAIDKTKFQFDFIYFTNKKGTAVITISSQNGTILQTIIDNAEKGLNYATYTFAFDQKKAVDLQKELKVSAINTAESGQTYLPAGKYKVTLQIGNYTATQMLDLVVNTRGQRSFEPEPKSVPDDKKVKAKK
mgnify:CR=1 FL=1